MHAVLPNEKDDMFHIVARTKIISAKKSGKIDVRAHVYYF